MSFFKSIVSFVNKLMFWIVSTAFVILSIILFYDVFARYFFNNPTSWAFDLSTWLTSIIAFLAGGFVLANNEHVRVDIFYNNFSERTKSFVNIISIIFIYIIVLVLLWDGLNQVMKNFESGATASTGLNVQIWLKWLMVPIGAFVLGLQAIVNMINDFYVLFTGRKLWNEEDG